MKKNFLKNREKVVDNLENSSILQIESRKIEKGSDELYPNLEAEMAREKITQAMLAEIISVTPTTMSLKLNGKGTFTLKECTEIKKKAFPNQSLDYLFKTEDPQKI